MCAVIETRHVSKNYKNLEAVKDVSISSERVPLLCFSSVGEVHTCTV